MTSQQTTEETFEIRALDTAEIDAVAGGYVPTIDVSGMPDRSEMCGTLWYLLRRMPTFPRP